MFRTYRIGTLLGFPIEVNLSFLLMLGAVLLFMGGVAGVIMVSIAFGSVLLHELGHAVIARRRGVAVAGIELHFFGGAAKMLNQPRTARDELAIAAAGPAVSFALALIGLALGTISGLHFVSMVGWINLVIATFNLVPALPMDGGRIFRAALSGRLGFLRATEISVSVARVFAVALGIFALATTQIFLLLLVFVLWTMGSAELAFARHMPFYPGDRIQPRSAAPIDVIWVMASRR